MRSKRCEDCKFFACYGYHSYGCENRDGAGVQFDDCCPDFEER